MKEAGVKHAILVPPSWEGDRVDYSLEAAQKYPNRFAVMGRFPIEKPSERAKLETWRDQKGMLGVRLTLHHEWDRGWMKHPRLRIIMDHLGARTTQKDDLLKVATDSTASLAKHPNVYVKLTLLPVFSAAPYPYKNIQPYIRHLVEAFGPNRCFWGTDASAMLERTSCSYGDCMKLFTEHMDFPICFRQGMDHGAGSRRCLDYPWDFDARVGAVHSIISGPNPMSGICPFFRPKRAFAEQCLTR